MANASLPRAWLAPFEEDHGDACGARFGMVILSVDETVENEYKRYFPYRPGVTVYHARQPKGPNIDVKTLERTAKTITSTSKLLPDFPYDAVGYACTSDAAVLGPDRIAGLVAAGAPVPSGAVTNPLTAGVRALQALRAVRVAVLTPYTEEVSQRVAQQFDARGLSVTSITIFNQTAETVPPRIRASSIIAAAEALAARDPEAHAIFISCTQTRTLDVIPEVEARISKPVVSSNQAMAWDMLRLGGQLTDSARAELSFGGRLFAVPVPDQGQRHACP